jgi:enoyl-CoA hydratase/carnithine racemase
MSFASREKTIISQWEVGVGMVAGGGPMARLPELIGRNRALEVLLSSEDIRADQAEAYGYINRALPDAELDAFVEALATRIAKFDKWAIANTSASSTPACRRTSSSVPGGMRASLRSGDPPPRMGSKR